jgi:hypothetical protein
VCFSKLEDYWRSPADKKGSMTKETNINSKDLPTVNETSGRDALSAAWSRRWVPRLAWTLLLAAMIGASVKGADPTVRVWIRNTDTVAAHDFNVYLNITNGIAVQSVAAGGTTYLDQVLPVGTNVRVHWGDYNVDPNNNPKPYRGALEDTGAIEYTTQTGVTSTPYFEFVIVTLPDNGGTLLEGASTMLGVSRTGSTSYAFDINLSTSLGSTAEYGGANFSKDWGIQVDTTWLGAAGPIRILSGYSSRSAVVYIWSDGYSGENQETAVTTLVSDTGSPYQARSSEKTSTITIEMN